MNDAAPIIPKIVPVVTLTVCVTAALSAAAAAARRCRQHPLTVLSTSSLPAAALATATTPSCTVMTECYAAVSTVLVGPCTFSTFLQSSPPSITATLNGSLIRCRERVK